MVESTSLPLGMNTTLSWAVRTRVERTPTDSTAPSMSPALIQSPRRKGRSVTRMPAGGR